MTNRDATANHLVDVLSLASPRTDCPTTLSSPASAVTEAAVSNLVQSDVSRQPLPDSGNVHGFLNILFKTDLELSRGDQAVATAIIDKFTKIETRGDAQAYADEVLTKARAAQANRAVKPAPRSRIGW